MMRAVLLSLSLLLIAVPAQAQRLIGDLSEHHVSLTSNFTGTEIIVFGSIEGELGDLQLPQVIVTVTGPETDVVVREKERHPTGIWINGPSVIVRDVPTFYYVASSAPLIEITSSSLRGELGIGTDVVGQQDLNNRDVEFAVYETFRNHMIDIRAAEGTVVQDENGVTFRGDRLFRARIPVPPTVPEGTYHVSFYLFEDGVLVGAQSAPLTVEKVGIEGRLTTMAHERPYLYGTIALLMAFMVGWVSTLVFRQN